VKDSWARSIKLKELQEELGKFRTESWSLLQAERYEEANALRRRLQDLDVEIAELKAEEAKAKELARRRKAAAAAAAGTLAVPSAGEQLRGLREELEQARLADDFERAVELRREMLAVQDGPGGSSSSSAAKGPKALPAPSAPLALEDATNPDFDPRETPGLHFELPVPKRRPAVGQNGLSGRAAERYTAMQTELEQAIASKDEATAADVRRRLEVFKAEFLEKKEEVSAGLPAGEPHARPRRQGRKGVGKGRGKAREPLAEQVEHAPAAKAKAKAKPRPGPVEPRPEPSGKALSAEQRRAKEQVQAWREEVDLLEQGLMDYRGDEDCRQAVDLRQRRDDMTAKIAELEQASSAGGEALEAALHAIDRASNPDSREAQLAALAKLNKMSFKR